jgi:uncharacterized membrane protein YagU involved in acid resistance
MAIAAKRPLPLAFRLRKVRSVPCSREFSLSFVPDSAPFVTFSWATRADRCRLSRREAIPAKRRFIARKSLGGTPTVNNLNHASQLNSAAIPVSSIPHGQATMQSSRGIPAIFWAGLICGVMDITVAFVNWSLRGVRPARLLQGIASGLLGPQSFRGGWPTVLLGAACHFFIAFSAAAVFYFASRKLAFLTHHGIVSGIAYGVSVYLVMYWIVMPLSRLVRAPFSLPQTLLAIVTHMLCVGLPISLTIRRYSV